VAGVLAHLSFLAGLAITLAAAPAFAGPGEGDTSDALPGVVRVPILSPEARGLAIAGSAGYGYTESVLGNGDAYSRASGSLAASYQPASYIALALRLDGRYDVDTGAQSANGATGTPTLEVRMMAPVGDALRLGGQLGIWSPGDIGREFQLKAVTPDASLLATYKRPESPLTLTSQLGIRWDNSTKSVADPIRLALPDHVELGLNAASAVLAGVGATYEVTPRVALLGDLTWDLLFGHDAPSIGDAPILASLGARYVVDDDGKLQLQATLTVSPSGRPAVSPTAPLVDIEPRVSAIVGVVVRPFAHRPNDSAPVAPLPTPLPPPLPARAKLTGHALAEDGRTALAHAHVVVTPASGGDKQETDTDQDGRFETGDVDVGEATLVITAPGFQTVTKTVTVAATPSPVEVLVARALPAGEVRGVVRDLAGKPLQAHVRIEPGGVEVTVGADGTFHKEVQPGTYDVAIHVSGYADQKRHIVVERDAVVLLNVELRRQGP
jgi:Carboxypeptidase regulatory-like domain